MSGALAGMVGPAASAEGVARMLAVAAYRGAEQLLTESGACVLGARHNGGVPLYTEGPVSLVAAGRVLRCQHPGAELARRLAADDTHDLDGAFAAAQWDGHTLTLLRDPFGQRAVYYAVLGETLVFASELKQLLALPDLPVAVDPIAVHTYLTFSFVPGELTPIAGVRRLPPGHRLSWRAGRVEVAPYFALRESLQPVEADDAVKALRRLGRGAVEARLSEGPAAVALSGGLDSSAVAFWLKRVGAPLTAFTLDFGDASVEREEAQQTARHVELPLVVVPARPEALLEHLDTLVWHLDMPFGDAVTGPQWLLGRAVREAGLESLWNGEGGDQLFGGWTSKPMVAAAVFGGEDLSLEEQYLRSYHRFYGQEQALYAPGLQAALSPGLRRATIARFLDSEQVGAFLNRVRLTDLSLKGTQNILPRAGRMAAAHALDVNMPLFDRRLAEWSFTLPTQLKLQGSCEKYVFKQAMQGRLPKHIVWRRKFGMGVPVTDWVQGGLRPAVEEWLSDTAVARRGLLQPAFVRALREGRDVASEARRRRLGERLWALLMLEGWMRRFIDRRGAPP